MFLQTAEPNMSHTIRTLSKYCSMLMAGALSAWNFVTLSPVLTCVLDLTNFSSTAASTATTALPSEASCGLCSMLNLQFSSLILCIRICVIMRVRF